MTQDEIIEMAREAGLNVDGDYFSDAIYRAVLVRFANLVAAKEREACAKVAENPDRMVLALLNVTSQPKHIAAAIRARGEQA